jgi:hypothetical protein
MGRLNRKKLLAKLAGTLGTVIALTMVNPQAASAQPGSRLCGTSWKSAKTAEVITRIYEVPKFRSGSVCNRASRMGMAIADSPFAGRLKDKDFRNWATFTVKVQRRVWSWGFGWNEVAYDASSRFRRVACESWRDRAEGWGGAGGRDLNFIGDDWPYPRNQTDICENMNRSDTLFDMHRYWLYNDNDPATPAVDFQHG